MKKNIIRHGEVILYPIDYLPKGSELQKEEKEVIVAHSETGHHHVLSTIDMSKIKIYSWNGETYLEVPSVSKLWHQKSGSDVHAPHKVVPSFYKIQIKKNFDYFEGKIKAVRD